MRKFRRIVSLAMAIMLILSSSIAVSAATVSTSIQPYTLSQEDMTSRVKEVVKAGQITYTSFYNVESQPLIDFQAAGQSARSVGGKVFMNFDTLIDEQVTGRIIVNPFLIKDTSGNVSLIVDSTDETNKVTKTKVEKTLGGKAAVFQCSQDDSFGFTVVLAAKLDLTGMDKNKLNAYSYDAANNKLVKLSKANCTADDKGFVYLETKTAGIIVISDK